MIEVPVKCSNLRQVNSVHVSVCCRCSEITGPAVVDGWRVRGVLSKVNVACMLPVVAVCDPVPRGWATRNIALYLLAIRDAVRTGQAIRECGIIYTHRSTCVAVSQRGGRRAFDFKLVVQERK